MSHRRATCDWRNLLRPPSRCQFWNPNSGSSASAFSAHTSEGKRKRCETTSGESSRVADEFSEFVEFLADADVLNSLQSIVEDAVQKLCEVTTEGGEHVFDLPEDSCSSTESASWSFSYSHTCGESSSAPSQSKYNTTTTITTSTTTSSSDDDWEWQCKRIREPKVDGRVCLLEKYASRLPRLEKKSPEGVSGGFHAESFSERSRDSYYRQERFHIWAKLAEAFQPPPKKDYFSKFQKPLPKQSLSIESLHKEITNVLKRPIRSSIPLYYPGYQHFHALDFLEENKILVALQDIINQAVLKVLEATLTDGISFLNLFDEHCKWLMLDSMFDSEEEEEESTSEETGSGEESGSGSEEEDSKSEGGSAGRKKKKRKGKRKKKKVCPMTEEEKGKQKYTPPPLPKSKRKSMVPDEPQRKPKYVPPPLPKSKPRPPPEEPPPKPKYTPPPLPKPKLKKRDSTTSEAETQAKQKTLAKLITAKDIKRARLQARPLPKQAIIDFLIENAAKLIIYKYNYETMLSEKLGLISVPVTKVLLEIMFGYKRIKGSGIRLSSQIDWTKVYEEIYAPRPPKPKTPKIKSGEKKKADKKKKKDEGKKTTPSSMKSGEKKSVLFRPGTPTGKVVLTKTRVEQEVAPRKPQKKVVTQNEPEIYEILPPQFPEDNDGQVISSTTKEPFSITNDSSKRSVTSILSSARLFEAPLPSVSPKHSPPRRASTLPYSKKEDMTVLPEVEPTDQPSMELLKKASSSRKASVDEGSKKSATALPKI